MNQPLIFYKFVLINDLMVECWRFDIQHNLQIVLFGMNVALLIQRRYFGIRIVTPTLTKLELRVEFTRYLHTAVFLIYYFDLVFVFADFLNILQYGTWVL